MIFDPAVFRELKDMMGEERASAVYQSFASDTQEKIFALKDNISDKNQIAASMHSLSSITGNMGFVKTREKCIFLMENAGNMNADEAAQVLDSIEKSFLETKAMFEEEFGL